MQLIKSQPANLHTFRKGDDIFEVTCVEGDVVRVTRQQVEYEDTGDAENGPHLETYLTEPVELAACMDYTEAYLLRDPDTVIYQCIEYPKHCDEMAAACYGDSHAS